VKHPFCLAPLLAPALPQLCVHTRMPEEIGDATAQFLGAGSSRRQPTWISCHDSSFVACGRQLWEAAPAFWHSFAAESLVTMLG